MNGCRPRRVIYAMCRGALIGVYSVSEQAWIDVSQWAEYRKILKVIEEIS